MIRIERGFEPPELRRMRRRHLARAVLARLDGRPEEFKGYDVAKEELWEAQHHKCAWCDQTFDRGFQPVEHLRPKSDVDRGDPTTTPPRRRPQGAGYWWLAWTWSNTLFGCVTCNGNKGIWFPLEPSTAALCAPPEGGVVEDALPCFDLTSERPALIDPSCEDPMRHIEWRPEDERVAPESMRWTPVHKTERGRVTIAVLHLHGWLKDRVTGHVKRRLWGSHLKHIAHLLATSRTVEARRAWRAMVAAVFAPEEPLHAASYDALRFLSRKLRWDGLSFDLPRPGALPLYGPIRAPLLDPPELQKLPARLRLEIHAAEKSTSDLMLGIYAHGVWSDAAMARTLGLREPTIRDHREQLVNAKTVIVAPGGGYTLAP